MKHTQETKNKISKMNKGKRLSIKTEFKKNEKHPQWKGNKASYKAFHIWLERYFGRPKNCEYCNNINAKRYDWALIKGRKYDHKRENFIRLCRGCHLKYDYTDQRKNKIREKLIGGKRTKKSIKKMSEARKKWWLNKF